MLQQLGPSADNRGVPRPAGAWGLLLLILLILVPATVSLAGSGDAHQHLTGNAVEQHEQVHGPLNGPVCRHDHHPEASPALVAESRDLEASPSGGDGMAAVPSQGPNLPRAPAHAASPAPAVSAVAFPGLPVYLLTRHLRV